MFRFNFKELWIFVLLAFVGMAIGNISQLLVVWVMSVLIAIVAIWIVRYFAKLAKPGTPGRRDTLVILASGTAVLLVSIWSTWLIKTHP